jgi:hypothetical protein
LLGQNGESALIKDTDQTILDFIIKGQEYEYECEYGLIDIKFEEWI